MEALGRHIVIGSDGAAFETARAACERGYDVHVLVPRGAPSVRFVPKDIRAVDWNPEEKGSLRPHMKDVSTVYYCCGSATLPVDEKEPEHLAAVLHAVSKAGARFVYCDAAYAYGNAGRPLSEDLPHRARDPMGVFLASLAEFVLQSHRMGHVEAVLARHAELIGPNVVRSHFGTQFVHAVLHKRPATVLGRADMPRSLTYAPDLGRALVFLGEQRHTWGQCWHVPSLAPITAERLANTLRAQAGMSAMAHGSLHEIRSGGSLFGGLGNRQKAQQMLARLYEGPFTLLSTKFERAFGMHATSLADAVEATLRSVKYG